MNLLEQVKTGKMFKAYKTSIDGKHDHWGDVYDLTREEAFSVEKFPLGVQTDPDGRKFIWQPGIND